MRRYAPACVRSALLSFRATSSATPGKVRVTFHDAQGKRHDCLATIGMTLMEVARDIAKLDMEAACDGTCACSTCHVYLDKPSFGKLGTPCEDEMDMLDLAIAPKETSRLACQVKLTAAMDLIEATLPKEAHNQLTNP